MASTSTTLSACSTGEDPQRMMMGEGPVASAAVTQKSRATIEVCGRGAAAATVTEVEQVHCECCGLAEECTPEYIAHVRGLHCGRWVCGLCAEAVKEERGGMEDALQAHMSFCLKFNQPEKEQGSPVADLAAAMRRLLRRSVDSSSSARSAPSSPRRPSSINRSLSTFSRGFEAPL